MGAKFKLLAGPRRPGLPPRISPLQRARIVELPGSGRPRLDATPVSSAGLARQAVRGGIFEAADQATVPRILDEVDLQPESSVFFRLKQ